MACWRGRRGQLWQALLARETHSLGCAVMITVRTAAPAEDIWDLA